MNKYLLWACASALSAGAAFIGCSGSSGSVTASGGDAAAGDDASTSDATPDTAADVPATPQHVTFSYKPSWSGVKSVTVIGGFGQASDWNAMQPFVALASDGNGGFSGAVDLPPGSYLYVFRVVGDAAAATPDTFARYAIDPTVSAYGTCPMQSPTYDKNNPNPCSLLTVPVASAPTQHHVRGTVMVDGHAAAGYLVVVEREEAMSHHFFENRATTGQDGTFDLVVAPGMHRLQLLHPTYLAQTDAMRDPIALAALRRAISSSFMVGADVTVPTPDLGYHAYAKFAPTGDGGALPADFTFGDGGARLTVYGTANMGAGSEIGDPWFASAMTANGTMAFDGGFNTKQANETAVKPGERYFWGVENVDRTDGGVSWTGQTMVFPITWH